MHVLIQATQPVCSQWTPDAVTRLVGELVVAVLAIIGAWKGLKADGKADVLNSRADSLASHAQSLERQVTGIAQNQQPPTTLPPTP